MVINFAPLVRASGMNCSTTHAMAKCSSAAILQADSANLEIRLCGNASALAIQDRVYRRGQSNGRGGEKRCQQPPGHSFDYSVLYTAKQMQF